MISTPQTAPVSLATDTLVLIDWENVGLSRNRPELLWAILNAAHALDPPVPVWVVGAHSFPPAAQTWLRNLGLHAEELVYIHSGDKIKNGSDIAMAVRAVDTLHARPYTRFALAAGDFDFRPLLMYLRGKKVRTQLIHTQASGLHKKLEAAADEVVSLGDLQNRGRNTPAGRPEGRRRTIPVPVHALLPVDPADIAEAVERLAHAADNGTLTTKAAREVIGEVAEYAGAILDALCTHNELSPRGALLFHSSNDSRNLSRLPLNLDLWIEEASLVWVASALAALAGRSSDAGFSAGVLDQARAHFEDPSALAFAWTRMQQWGSLPRFAERAAKSGLTAPTDPCVRRDVLTHLAETNYPGTSPLDITSLTTAVRTAQARLARSDLKALLEGLQHTPSSQSTHDWLVQADAEWISAVIRAGRPTTAEINLARVIYEVRERYLAQSPPDYPVEDILASLHA